MISKIVFLAIGYLVIGTFVTGWVIWYTDSNFCADDAIDIMILIAIWPITAIAGVFAVFAGLAIVVSKRLKSKKH